VQPIARHRYTFADYLALEECSNVKHEYFGGEIYAMAGGTPEHAALAAACSATLLDQLRGGPCRVYSSDLRVRVLSTGLAAYPDVTVVCGPSERDPESSSTVTNPRLIVEVLSDATRDYDCGEKLENYQRIPSLEMVLLVDHEERRVELHARASDGSWTRSTATRGQRLALEPLGCELDVDSLYDVAVEPSQPGE
jgi:Uma2 family endonuclease